MIGTWNGLRALAGDALIAVGATMRGDGDEFSEREAAEFLLASGRMESDGPDATAPVPGTVGAELADLPDLQLIRMAAQILRGWIPILLATQAGTTDVEAFVAELEDRAAQFAVVEADAVQPFLTPAHLTDSLRAATDFFPQSRGK